MMPVVLPSGEILAKCLRVRSAARYAIHRNARTSCPRSNLPRCPRQRIAAIGRLVVPSASCSPTSDAALSLSPNAGKQRLAGQQRLVEPG